jgi:RNA polymerase sigma-54 factor
LEDELTEQLQFLNLSDEERLFGEYVIGNVDADGYLRRDLNDLISEVNAVFSEHDLALHAPMLLGAKKSAYEKDLIKGIDRSLMPISLKQADQVVKKIQMLDPPGFASRNVQECLIAQLKTVRKPNAAQKLALLVLTDAYEAFAMKHFNVIERQLDVTEEYLREAIDVIRHLNPRPGSGTIEYEVNTLVPDFIIEKTEDGSDFSITVNDSRLPTLRVSNAYERLKREARNHKFNKETREWLRKKYEDAKFLIQAIRQRKSTMLRVMTAIAGLQTEFLKSGPIGLKPLIYRDVAAITGLDISTICRIVNGKYVQTEFGTFELKYFFSESLITEEGEEVSTRIIKQKIRDLIGDESKVKPLSDEKLARDLKKVGYKVARRTVAKYREQLRIPVARLRREL